METKKMDILTLWQEKSDACKNLIGASAANNFDGNIHFEVLANKTEPSFNKDTKFQAASLRKLIGALVSAMYMATQNKSLHSSLFGQLQIPVRKETTFKHILSHSAGFNVRGFPGYEKQPIPDITEVIAGSGAVQFIAYLHFLL